MVDALLPAYFIDPALRSERTKPPVFYPSRIPIHPQVCDADSIYNIQFMTRVRNRLTDVLQDDIREIAARMGKDYLEMSREVHVTATGIEDCYERVKFEQFYHGVNNRFVKCRQNIWVNLPHLQNLGMKLVQDDVRTYDINFKQNPRHPFPREIAQEYAIDPDAAVLSFYTWSVDENITNRPALFHYLRAFALTFNNEGLDSLGLLERR